MPRVKLIQIRGGTASAWTTANPVLALREIGFETDTRKIKFGDGVSAWGSLFYSGHDIQRADIDTSPGTIFLDLQDTEEMFLSGSPDIDSVRTISLDNASNSKRFLFYFEISDLSAVLTFPGNFEMLSDSRWNSGAKTWTPAATGFYIASASWVSNFVGWVMEISGASTGGGGGGTWGSITGTLSAQTDLQAALDAKQESLGFTAENAANKATDFSTIDNTKYPTTQAVNDRILAREAGLAWKSPVVVATTANITLSGEQTIDGVLTSASRVLVKNQSTPSQNGIYVSAAGSWVRSTDADTGSELEGATVTSQQGTTNANTTWTQTTDGVTVGSSSVAWTQFGSSVPDASSTVKGIAKLYIGAGSNTDGPMDQNSITTALSLKVAKAGDTMGGNLAMGANKVTGLGAASANGDAVRFEQLPASSSETVSGLIEIATQAETDAGTDDVRSITPLKGATKYANKLETINTQTGSYTLVLTDKDIKTVVMNVASTSNSVTVPPNSSVAFPVGSIISIAQLGTGLTSMVAGAGVTIRSSTGSLAGQGQYSPMVIEKIGTDEWFLWNGPPAIAGAALTRTNDTNVTATLSGSPSTALLAAVEIALSWTGTLSVTRGGTGLSSSANGDVIIGTASNAMGVVNALATTRTALWHLKAGTATASTAPLKFTSGTNLTAVENGAVEYDGTNYFVSSGGVRYTLAKILANSSTIDFGSVSAQSEVSNTITVTGAADGDEVILGYTNAAANAGLIFSARVSATNTVTVTAYNITVLPIDPASATFKVSVIKR